ncbi:MAG TPA: nitrate- and nitrite sensing domain-containing protein [Streptosporangiaceae bacterium]|jgi:signal transduction histidine kinase
MRFRNTRLRTKITALLMSLAALWAFAAWVTLREGLNLLGVSTFDQKVTRPAVALVTELQKERRLSVVYLGRPILQQRQALDTQRAATDQAQKRFRTLASGGDVARAASDTLEARIKDTFRQLDGLAPGRAAIDTLTVSRGAAATPFNAITDAAFRIFGSAGSVDDEAIAKDSRTLNSLIRAKEILSREDALLAGVIAAGRFTAAEHDQFIELVGAQRFLHDEAAAELPPADHARYEKLVTGQTFVRFRTLEDRVIQRGRAGARPPVTAKDWQSALEPTLTGLEQVVLTGGEDLVQRAKPVGIGVIVRLFLAGGLGLIAVIASIVVSITTARALFRQLQKLQEAAWELARKRLPGVVERLGHGEDVDVQAEAPPLAVSGDAVGQVSRAFNAVQETAIRSAVEQAELRRGIRDILLSLARRSQALVHRQLTLLDKMERREMDTSELEDLFRLDHLATRMRRNAENLIVLSGATPARGWRRAVPMMDVVRAAVAEVEDYTRVTVLPMGPISLSGRAVGDITHLLAELIENAVSFSPPPAMVQVSAHFTARGYAIEIEDRGLGINEERLASINQRISDPPEFNLSRSVQLGLYVVGRLAQRYGLRVTLKNSAYGGTTAVVLVPNDLLIEEDDFEARSELGSSERMAVAAVVAGPVAIGSGTDAPVTIDDSAGIEPMADRPDQPEWPDEPIPPASVPDRRIGTEPTVVGAAVLGETPPIDGPRAGEPPAEGPFQESGESMQLTPSGLPFRVPQASIAPPLRNEGPSAEEQQPSADDERRSPEEVRKLVGSYLTGSSRGRSDAAALRNSNNSYSNSNDTGPVRPVPPVDDEPPE